MLNRRQQSATTLHLAQILDLFGEDDQLNVYAGERELRPPSALTARLVIIEGWAGTVAVEP